jgi:hypothetical protein
VALSSAIQSKLIFCHFCFYKLDALYWYPSFVNATFHPYSTVHNFSSFFRGSVGASPLFFPPALPPKPQPI